MQLYFGINILNDQILGRIPIQKKLDVSFIKVHSILHGFLRKQQANRQITFCTFYHCSPIRRPVHKCLHQWKSVLIRNVRDKSRLQGRTSSNWQLSPQHGYPECNASNPAHPYQISEWLHLWFRCLLYPI